jgi:hypothetical protein
MAVVTMRFTWWLSRIVATAALATALCLVVVWTTNLALTRAIAEEGDTGPIVSALNVLGWVELGLAVVVVGGLAVGAWLHRPVWARGVASVIVGTALHWGWWLLDRHVDPFRVNLPDADDGLLGRVTARMWTTLGVDVLAIGALVLGGVLLLRRERPAVEADDVEPARIAVSAND